jgi:hypothetical protein
MERPEDDAPLADPSRGGGAVPNDMPIAPQDDDALRERPERTERQRAEPRPDDED